MDFDILAGNYLKLERQRVKTVAVVGELIYHYLVRMNIITPIWKLPREEKVSYWRQTEGSKFRRKITCDALYVYDTLKQMM